MLLVTIEPTVFAVTDGCWREPAKRIVYATGTGRSGVTCAFDRSGARLFWGAFVLVPIASMLRMSSLAGVSPSRHL